jgi:hypothetical protein
MIDPERGTTGLRPAETLEPNSRAIDVGRPCHPVVGGTDRTTRGEDDMHGILFSSDPGYLIGEALAILILFVVLAVVIGAGVLLVMISWRAAFAPRRPRTPRPPAPPDDWDDEEYIARHHH